MAPHRPTDAAGRRAQTVSWSAVNYLLRSGFSWSGHERNTAYANLGDGSFVDVSHLTGLAFDDDARGVAGVDWDGDGDLDLWINNRSSPKARLLRNDHKNPGHWLELQLIGGPKINRDAVGARARVKLRDGRELIGTVRAGVNYTVQGSKRLHFGLGDETEVAGLSVRWPDGSESEHEVPEVDARFVIRQGEATLSALAAPRAPSRLQEEEFVVPAHPRAASVPLGTALEVPSDLGMVDFSGRRHTLADYTGKPLLINLWASWCAPCRTEFGDFEKHREELERTGLEILACSVDEELPAAVAAADDLGLPFPAGTCDPELLGLLDVVKKVVFDRYEELLLPTSLLLDSQGRLARIYLGPSDARQLASDVIDLESAGTDLDRLELASVGDGEWVRPDIWMASQRGSRLVRMTEFLSNDNATRLTAFYGDQLADYVDRQQPPERAMIGATNAMVVAARTVLVDDPAAAARLYGRVLEYRPGHVEASLGQAAALLDAGELEGIPKARQALELVARLTGSVSSEIAAHHGTLLRQLGKPREALPHLEVAVEADPWNPRLQLELAIALDGAGRRQDAVARYEQLLETAPEAPTASEHARLGETLFRLDRPGEAIPHLTSVVAEDPERLNVRVMLGLALARTGRDADARGHLEASLPGLPRHPGNEYLLGIVRARTGSLESAVDSFERVLELEPGHTQARLSLARANEQLGRREEAIRHFRLYLEAAPEDAETRSRLASLLGGSAAGGSQ